MPVFAPPYTHPLNLSATLRQQGYAILPPADVAQLAACTLSDLQTLDASWNDLSPDLYLKDGGQYRRRRHGSAIVRACDLPEGKRGVQRVPQRAHWQPLAYNALHGGMERWFEPLSENVWAAAQQGALSAILIWLARLANQLHGAHTAQPWYTEMHQFRIDTTGGIGRPTPEGAHRDGVDWVAVFLVARVGIKGGETRVFEADGPRGQRFTLTEPWSMLLLDDSRVIHETTPIQPTGDAGYRDTLVVTLRSGGFLDAPR